MSKWEEAAKALEQFLDVIEHLEQENARLRHLEFHLRQLALREWHSAPIDAEIRWSHKTSEEYADAVLAAATGPLAEEVKG